MMLSTGGAYTGGLGMGGWKSWFASAMGVPIVPKGMPWESGSKKSTAAQDAEAARLRAEAAQLEAERQKLEAERLRAERLEIERLRLEAERAAQAQAAQLATVTGGFDWRLLAIGGLLIAALFLGGSES